VSVLSKLVKPNIKELTPYPPGKPIEEVERELGITGSVKLASNESPLGPSRRAVEAIYRVAENLNRYPDGSQYYLREALAEHLSVGANQFVFGAGSDEVLDLIGKAFFRSGDEVVYHWPSFAMYPIVAAHYEAKPVQVPLDANFGTDVSAVLGAVTERTRAVILANPNNPTGVSIGRDDFQKLIEELPEDVLLVSDEAYNEFVRSPDFPETVPQIKDRPTLVVMRTFSKVYGLAALRVGYAIGDPELIDYLERARHPFNVNTPAQAAAVAALGDREHLARLREVTHQGLEALERGLDALGIPWVPSDANFLLVEVGEGAVDLYERLMRRGVITRPLHAFGLDRHLRVTAGLPEENARFLEALAAELRG